MQVFAFYVIISSRFSKGRKHDDFMGIKTMSSTMTKTKALINNDKGRSEFLNILSFFG